MISIHERLNTETNKKNKSNRARHKYSDWVIRNRRKCYWSAEVVRLEVLTIILLVAVVLVLEENTRNFSTDRIYRIDIIIFLWFYEFVYHICQFRIINRFSDQTICEYVMSFPMNTILENKLKYRGTKSYWLFVIVTVSA